MLAGKLSRRFIDGKGIERGREWIFYYRLSVCLSVSLVKPSANEVWNHHIILKKWILMPKVETHTVLFLRSNACAYVCVILALFVRGYAYACMGTHMDPWRI